MGPPRVTANLAGFLRCMSSASIAVVAPAPRGRVTARLSQERT